MCIICKHETPQLIISCDQIKIDFLCKDVVLFIMFMRSLSLIDWWVNFLPGVFFRNTKLINFMVWVPNTAWWWIKLGSIPDPSCVPLIQLNGRSWREYGIVQIRSCTTACQTNTTSPDRSVWNPTGCSKVSRKQKVDPQRIGLMCINLEIECHCVSLASLG